MKDILLKSRLSGLRGSVIQTSYWDSIADFYRDLIDRGLHVGPMLELVEEIGNSSVARQIFGATSISALMLSDSANFCFGDSTLVIAYRTADRVFEFEHHGSSGCDEAMSCAESEALQTLGMFLQTKYGILFELPSLQH